MSPKSALLLHDANKTLLENLLVQNQDMKVHISELEVDYELLKSRTNRTIGYLKDQIAWLKAWNGALSLIMTINVICWIALTLSGVW